MDLVEKIVWIMLLVSLIGFFSLQSAFGEDKYEVIRFIHKDNPNVCIMQPEPDLQERFHEEVLDITINSVLSWQDEMRNMTDGNWIMPLEYHQYEEHFDKYPEDYKQCNVFIEYRHHNTGEEGTKNTKALGFTAFDYSKSSHQYAYVLVYLYAEKPTPTISLCLGCDDNTDSFTVELAQLPLPSDTINRIIMHELGHSLGIGHYFTDQRVNNNIPSLMFPTLEPFDKNISYDIENVDKEMLIKLYTEDGFGGLWGLKPYSFDVKITENGLILE
jgi:hypothetical protein